MSYNLLRTVEELSKIQDPELIHPSDKKYTEDLEKRQQAAKKRGGFVNPLFFQARHATSQHSGTPVTNIHSPTQRMGDALVALRPSQLRTKPCSVKTTSNGWTAIRNAILASLARY